MRPPQPGPKFDAWLARIDSEIHDQLDQHLHTARLDQAPPPTSKIRILLVDDHALMRLSLRTVLEAEPDIEVVGEAGGSGEALAKAAELLPDFVLLDIKIPSRANIEAVTAIKGLIPSARIVMLTMSENEEDLYKAIKAGASGYLLKDLLPHEIADSIRAVVGGQSLISPPMAAKLLTEFAAMARHGEDQKDPGPPAPKLTVREVEVLRLLASGANINRIANTLFISENTVKSYVRNILEKLQHHSRMQAVMDAARPSILDAP
jgi:DNA-binding NarL/FixJ family response regulator